MLSSFLFLILTVLFLIPFGLALIYFILGVTTLLRGVKEKSRVKTLSGCKTIFIASISLVAICLGYVKICFPAKF